MSNKTFRKVFTFDKVDYNHIGRRINAASLEVEYRLKVKYQNGEPSLYWEYSACGAIWNHIHTDHISGGQILESMAKFAAIRNDKNFSEAFSLWKVYHLNGLTAGSPAQEAAKGEFKVDREKTTWYWYDKADITENTDHYGRHMTDDEATAKAAEAAGHFVKAEKGDYNDQLAIFLARGGLYTDHSFIYEGKPYKYAHAWLTTEIPESDKARIRALLGITKADEENAEAEARRELETTKGAA